MENLSGSVEVLLKKTGDYVDTRIDLFKLKAIDKSADVVSSLFSRLIVFFIIALFFIFLNIGVALVIGEQLDKTYYGFFILAGFYGIAGLVLYAFKNTWLKAPVSDKLIKKLL